MGPRNGPQRVVVVTPAAARSHVGNRVTAERYLGLFEGLEFGGAPLDLSLAEAWNGEPCDLLVAIHARKSFPSIARFAAAYPNAPLIVVLAGTDLSVDLLSHDPRPREEAAASLDLATAIVTLQPRALLNLAPRWRDKARAILQSALPPRTRAAVNHDRFEVVVLAHLRAIKDPLRAAHAVRDLDPTSRLSVVHAGAALDSELALAAREEERSNPRYRWLGDLDHEAAIERLAASRLLVVTSHDEGGANVVSEALACRVPVISSWIDGTRGVLGDDYPGYFPVGNTAALRALLVRAERDEEFRQTLTAYTASLAPLVEPPRERAAWRMLLSDVLAL